MPSERLMRGMGKQARGGAGKHRLGELHAGEDDARAHLAGVVDNLVLGLRGLRDQPGHDMGEHA